MIIVHNYDVQKNILKHSKVIFSLPLMLDDASYICLKWERVSLHCNIKDMKAVLVWGTQMRSLIYSVANDDGKY